MKTKAHNLVVEMPARGNIPYKVSVENVDDFRDFFQSDAVALTSKMTVNAVTTLHFPS